MGGDSSQEFEGVAVLALYGSEGNVNIFKCNPDASDFCAEPGPCGQSRNVPIAVVDIVC